MQFLLLEAVDFVVDPVLGEVVGLDPPPPLLPGKKRV